MAKHKDHNNSFCESNTPLWTAVQYILFYKEHFYKQHQAEIGKKQVNAKQHPEAELLLFENYSHSSSTVPSKHIRTYFFKKAKLQVCLYSWDYTINHNKNKDKHPH